MSELDVIKLHTGLQHEYGLDAGYLSDVSSTSSTYLLAANGLPMKVGWFDNSKKSLPGPNVYALTAHPDNPRNMHHRLMLEQVPGIAVASLVEEDSADYLEGLDDYPYLIRRDRLQQPAIEETIRNLCLGAYVLNSLTGNRHASFAWEHSYKVRAVREHGLAIIEAGDVLARVDADMLNRYSENEPPTLH